MAPRMMLAAVVLIAPLALASEPGPARPSVVPDAAASASLSVHRHLPRGPVTLDCPEGACPEILPAGDAVYVLPDWGPPPFRGLADPSIRRDPVTGRLWLAYSWLHWQLMPVDGGTRGVGVVDIHLAHSDDSGGTWAYDGPLWTSQVQDDPGAAGRGFTSHEVASLAPGTLDGAPAWFAARLTYMAPHDSRLYSPRLDSFHIRVAQAASPPALAVAAEARLGGPYTAAGWNADVNLAALSPDLSLCTLLNEPALLFDSGTLYLGVQCEVWSEWGHETAYDFLGVFATNPSGDVRTWSWRYLGKLATSDDGTPFEADELMQLDLARGRDGQLLAVVSPSYWDPRVDTDVHKGCVALEVASLDPPALRYGRSGAPVVRAVVTASDLGDYGSAACAYEPSSSTGLLFTRRILDPYLPEMLWSLHGTGLAP